jgi:hypothetical protein
MLIINMRVSLNTPKPSKSRKTEEPQYRNMPIFPGDILYGHIEMGASGKTRLLSSMGGDDLSVADISDISR